jgi:hypothetical protein
MKWIRRFELFLEAQSQFKVQAQNDLEKTIYKPRLSKRFLHNKFEHIASKCNYV